MITSFVEVFEKKRQRLVTNLDQLKKITPPLPVAPPKSRARRVNLYNLSPWVPEPKRNK